MKKTVQKEIPFYKLNKQGKKIWIVKDVLEQVKAGVIIPDQVGYFKLADYTNLASFDRRFSLQTAIKQRGCTGCAKGSLFACHVLKMNKVLTGDNVGNESFQKEHLKKYFSSLELDMIEAAFEKTVVKDETKRLTDYNEREGKFVNSELGKQCIRFGKRFGSAKNRFIAIMKNILEHGQFTP